MRHGGRHSCPHGARRTVRDLVAGSGLRFVDRGEYALKGVPDTWSLYEVDSLAR